MTNINMPALMAPLAQKKESPAARRLPENSSGSFRQQLKRMSSKSSSHSPGQEIAAGNSGRSTGQPDSNQVKADSKAEAITAGDIKNPGPDSGKSVAPDLQETGAEGNNTAAQEVVPGIAEEPEATAVAAMFIPLFPAATLAEAEEGQVPLNPGTVAANQVLSENPDPSAAAASEASAAEKGANPESVHPALTVAPAAIPAPERNASLLSADAVTGTENQAAQPTAGDEGVSPAAVREASISTLPAPEEAGPAITVADRPSGTVLSEDNTVVTPAISNSENEAEPARQDELVQDHSRPEGKAKQVSAAAAGDKVVKEAPEIKQWVKELLADSRGKAQASPDPGAEEKQPGTGSKTAPATDVKKLIDFESQRFNGRRLSSEPPTTAEAKAQVAGDEGKGFISELARNSADGLKTAVPGTESSRNLPSAREIMAQVVQKAELLFNHKLSELKIDLKPEFLGRLTIKVMVEEGVVTARFIAENQQVRHLLENNLPALRQNLEAQGLRVDRAEVNVALNNGGMFDGSEGSRQYLWQEGQSPGRHQGEAYSGDSYNDTMYPEEMNSAVIGENETGFNENGQLSFLV
jgi:flagellar hook-length control protein FliK